MGIKHNIHTIYVVESTKVIKQEVTKPPVMQQCWFLEQTYTAYVIH
jgi:hypothetical protein